MPSYHLHLINTHVDADDSEGHDLPSLAAARSRAIEGIRGFLGEELTRGTLDLRGRIDIEDDAGAVLLVVTFAEAIQIKTP